MGNPTVSICIPVYNGEASIAATIQEVLNQSFTDFELIIVNDASNDKTEDIILGFNDSRIKYISNPHNLGMVGNWNKAVSFAKGRYIKLLCADDLIETNCLQEQVKALESNPSTMLVTCNSYIVDSSSNIIGVRKNFNKEGLYGGTKIAKRSLIFGRNLFGESSVVLYRREALESIGLYDENFWYAPDWDFSLRVLNIGDLYYINKTLASFRLSNTNQTSKIINKNKWTIMREDMKFLDKHTKAIQLNILEKSAHYIGTAAILIMKYIYLKVIFSRGGRNAKPEGNKVLKHQGAQ